MTRRVAAALLMGALGAVWVIFRADFNALVALEIGRGEAIYFLGCVAHALYTPLVPKLNRGQSPVVFTFGMMVAALLLTSIYAIDDLRKTEFLSLRPMIWVTLVYLAVCASAASFFFVAVLGPSFADEQSHGVYVYDANLGHPVGDCTRRGVASGWNLDWRNFDNGCSRIAIKK